MIKDEYLNDVPSNLDLDNMILKLISVVGFEI
jgi:hypothetical protein